MGRGADSAVPALVDITNVAVIGDHRLRLSFEDGTVGNIGFEQREWRGVFEPLADPDVFAQVRIDAGAIAWPKGLEMAPKPLYEAATRRPVVRHASCRGGDVP